MLVSTLTSFADLPANTVYVGTEREDSFGGPSPAITALESSGDPYFCVRITHDEVAATISRYYFTFSR